jgi:hypothetical protein
MCFDLPLQSAFAIMDGNHDSALVFPESYMLGMRAGLVWSRIDVYVTILKNTHPLQAGVQRWPLSSANSFASSHENVPPGSPVVP